MHPRFEAYRSQPIAKEIEAIARKPEHIYGYTLLSKLGVPAVVAISWDVAPLLRNLPSTAKDEAKQFCGALVGDIMRERGYDIVNPRGSARAGGVFTVGAVWGEKPKTDADFEEGLRIAERAMDTYRNALAELAK